MATKSVLIPRIPSAEMYKKHSEQPFYVLDDKSYDRMLKTLKEGTGSVKSYINICPHNRKQDCQCEYFTNYLDEDGDIVRNHNGVIKPVLKLSMLSNISHLVVSMAKR